VRAAASVPVQIRLLGPFSFPLLRQPVAQHLDRVTSTPVPRLSDEGGARKNAPSVHTRSWGCTIAAMRSPVLANSD
jgi:hypothetical protein